MSFIGCEMDSSPSAGQDMPKFLILSYLKKTQKDGAPPLLLKFANENVDLDYSISAKFREMKLCICNTNGPNMIKK